MKRYNSPKRSLAGFTPLLSAIACVFLAAAAQCAAGEKAWQTALSRMPLGTGPLQLNRTNAVRQMLGAFQSNSTVRALIFMPGATDEFYMFHRAKAQVTNNFPSLLDAVNALTNQTLIQATFHAPFLLLHTAEDPLEPLVTVKHRPTAKLIKGKRLLEHAVENDRDWDYMLPILEEGLQAAILPERYSTDSWHFYRHSFAACGLNGLEALEAVALAGKTRCEIRTNQLIFEGDTRVRALPKLDGYVP